MDDDFSWVPAAPFRALLQHLIAVTGRPWPELAAQARVPVRLTHHLLFGYTGRRLHRIPHAYARRIVALERDLSSRPTSPSRAA